MDKSKLLHRSNVACLVGAICMYKIPGQAWHAPDIPPYADTISELVCLQSSYEPPQISRSLAP